MRDLKPWMTLGIMTDQIKRLVEQGQLLNYDVCFQTKLVASLAAQNTVPNDDLNMSLSKDKLCRIYYKNAFWRGGINSNIDDRVDTKTSTMWDSNAAKTSKSAIECINADYESAIARARQSIVSYHIYGNSNDLNAANKAKATIEALISKVAAERKKLETVLDALRKENSDEMLQQVADNEINLRKMTLENEEFKRGNELRKEQAKDLNTRFDPNFHSTAFGYIGYKPMRQESRSAIIFISFFMGFIGLIVLGIKIVPLVMKDGFTFSTPSLVASSGYESHIGIKKPVAQRF